MQYAQLLACRKLARDAVLLHLQLHTRGMHAFEAAHVALALPSSPVTLLHSAHSGWLLFCCCSIVAELEGAGFTDDELSRSIMQREELVRQICAH